MRISIILGSARPDGNTEKVIRQIPELEQAFLLKLADHQVYHYNYEHQHPEDDEFMSIMEELIPKTDLFLFATPIYWYAMSGHMKVFLDRFTDLLKINKPLGRTLRGKSMAMLSCSNGDDRPAGFDIPFELTADYLGMEYKGNVHYWLEDGQIFKSAVGEINY
ncbi:MAG: NAD(P)H-dependent oxidoreductase [Saprospiraceae bacterium]|nr:NAD(P)H-dependent oxidoreductase [Saprospiraceae bacterium]